MPLMQNYEPYPDFFIVVRNLCFVLAIPPETGPAPAPRTKKH